MAPSYLGRVDPKVQRMEKVCVKGLFCVVEHLVAKGYGVKEGGSVPLYTVFIYFFPTAIAPPTLWLNNEPCQTPEWHNSKVLALLSGDHKYEYR